MSISALNRRRFCRIAGAAVASPWLIPAAARGAEGNVAPNERITVGFIGVGGHGVGRNLKMFLGQPDCQPAAVCDVDSRRIDVALQTIRQARGDGYSGLNTGDWREVIARPDIDAVMISTPDHWHVPMALAAIRAGKDVICEKPTVTIAEGRELVDAVDRYGAVFQLSTEDRSVPVYHRMAELVRNGRIGTLKRIEVGLPAGPKNAGNATPRPVPKELDWDMWLGPAPWAPYRDGLHAFHWRWNSDYSGGMMTDWGAHLFDTAQWANDTERTGPIRIEGTGQRHQGGLYDTFHQFEVRYEYANGVEMITRSGTPAIRFEGTDGWLGNHGWRAKLEASSREILDSQIGPDELHLFTCPGGEHRNFLDCVKSRKDPYFPAEIGHRCCTVAHLGNMAMELGRPLRWDPDGEEFLDDPMANRLRARVEREAWRG
jgi:predicted dehydrogenase